MSSASLDLSGTVYDPAIPYAAPTCELDVTQNGNALTGTICLRDASFSF